MNGLALGAALATLVLPPLLLARAASRAAATARAARIEAFERVLPQTQCGQCDFAGCTPYAEAMADGLADGDRCPPGGDAGAFALARLLGQAPRPVDPARGVTKPPLVAWIREEDCIGCTKCIQACPVDAIVGASKLMHTVLPDLCTGCELCLPPCPVDCIEVVGSRI